MKRYIWIVFITFAFLTACQPSEEEKVELTISAAASLQEALTEIKSDFETEHPHIDILYNFGGSGALKEQISQGAPVDLFFSASQEHFEKLIDEGLMIEEKTKPLIQNELVLIVPNSSNIHISSLEDLPSLPIDQLAIGTPESVPAGKYGQEALESADVWENTSEKLVYAKDVRQVLTYVETGNVDAGIVYKTDAISSKKVKIALAIDSNKHSEIVYPLGIIKATKHNSEVEDFYQYLFSDKAISVLEQYGFKRIEK